MCYHLDDCEFGCASESIIFGEVNILPSYMKDELLTSYFPDGWLLAIPFDGATNAANYEDIAEIP